MNYSPYTYCIIDSEFSYVGSIIPNLIEVNNENMFMYQNG